MLNKSNIDAVGSKEDYAVLASLKSPNPAADTVVFPIICNALRAGLDVAIAVVDESKFLPLVNLQPENMQKVLEQVKALGHYPNCSWSGTPFHRTLSVPPSCGAMSTAFYAVEISFTDVMVDSNSVEGELVACIERFVADGGFARLQNEYVSKGWGLFLLESGLYDDIYGVYVDLVCCQVQPPKQLAAA